MPIARNPRLKPLQEFAKAVGAKIKVEYTDDLGQGTYVLIDSKGEPVVHEYDTYDMLDSIQVYYGGHPGYEDARQKWELQTGEVRGNKL